MPRDKRLVKIVRRANLSLTGNSFAFQVFDFETESCFETADGRRLECCGSRERRCSKNNMHTSFLLLFPFFFISKLARQLRAHKEVKRDSLSIDLHTSKAWRTQTAQKLQILNILENTKFQKHFLGLDNHNIVSRADYPREGLARFAFVFVWPATSPDNSIETSSCGLSED
jgi:hypothetical protein